MDVDISVSVSTGTWRLSKCSLSRSLLCSKCVSINLYNSFICKPSCQLYSGYSSAEPACSSKMWRRIGLDWIEQGLTSPPTQYRLSGRQFYRSKDPTNSIKVLLHPWCMWRQLACWPKLHGMFHLKFWDNVSRKARSTTSEKTRSRTFVTSHLVW